MSAQNRPQTNEAGRVCDQPDLSHLSPEVSEAIKGLNSRQKEIVIQSFQAVR